MNPPGNRPRRIVAVCIQSLTPAGTTCQAHHYSGYISSDDVTLSLPLVFIIPDAYNSTASQTRLHHGYTENGFRG